MASAFHIRQATVDDVVGAQQLDIHTPNNLEQDAILQLIIDLVSGPSRIGAFLPILCGAGDI